MLRPKCALYLEPDEVAKVERAYRFAEQAHEGVTRKSGDPYITHPLAVAEILAEMKLDVDSLCAALLHDVIEDTNIPAQKIAERFGNVVAELVEGVTKLKVLDTHSRSYQEVNAQNLIKLFLAMSRDLRVTLIKLADRLHNMRTLGSMRAESRRRIARETLDIFAPIAQRLGMNAMKAELQNRSFEALHPWRSRTLKDRLDLLYGERTESAKRIANSISDALRMVGISARIVSRMKSTYSIHTKMKADRKGFDEVLDTYGVRVIVAETLQCYQALGVIHQIFKPRDKTFRDWIAIPKNNGYQSLHTVCGGPGAMLIEVQIRTEEMDLVAERGVAAHWSYKGDGAVGSIAQVRARQWVEGLLDSRSSTSSSAEFLEHVKVELFPDDVFVFTPKGDVLELPRHATAIDFAYTVHSQIGAHAVSARIDGKLAPLHTRLSSGQTIEIITANSAQPQIVWLNFAVSSRARYEIRHALKQVRHDESIEVGHRLLDRELMALGISIEQISAAMFDAYLQEHRLRRQEDLFTEIALGNLMPQMVAHALIRGIDGSELADGVRVQPKLLISGSEREVVTFGNCCHPLPGDPVFGFLSPGKGVVVHTVKCKNLNELRKHPERMVEVAWSGEYNSDFKVWLKVVVDNKPGVLAKIAAAFAKSDANIDSVDYQERDMRTAAIKFVVDVKSRQHLATVMRRLRALNVIHSVTRQYA